MTTPGEELHSRRALQSTIELLEQRVATLENELMADAGIKAAPAIISAERHLDTSWLLITSSLVFLMQLGFAMLEGGMCRQNNVISTYMKNLLDFVFGSVVAYGFGYTIAYGTSPWLADYDEYMFNSEFFHHLVFQATAATIVSGAVAERTKMQGYVILSCFISGGPFSLAVRWTWGGGWLNSFFTYPFHDFAGSCIVHVVGGWSALAAVAAIGERNGRYETHRFYDFMPTDVGAVLGGTLVLWVGWYGFNTGSTNSLFSDSHNRAAANAALTTTLGASSACIGSLVIMVARAYMAGHKPSIDAIGVANGVLAGLVAITAGADVLMGHHSLVIGLVAAFVYAEAAALTEKLQLDDVCEAWAVHGCCGVWGTVAVGFFHPEQGLLYTGSFALLWIQTVGCMAIVVMTTVPVYLLCLGLQRLHILRVPFEEEARGLDHKFGSASSSYMLEKNQRLRMTFITLQAYGGSLDELLTTLQGLHSIIFQPFTPQAGEYVIEGQVSQILQKLDWDLPLLQTSDFVAFLSHHKLDAGDAARVFVDTARRLIEQRRMFHRRMLQKWTAAQKEPRPETIGTNWWVEGGDLPIQADSLIFLDSNNLSDLKTLLVTVTKCTNYILMMSRSVLERPWVLCEFIAAIKAGKTPHVVVCGWPGTAADKEFKYPRHLDETISDWKNVRASQRLRMPDTQYGTALVKSGNGSLTHWAWRALGEFCACQKWADTKEAPNFMIASDTIPEGGSIDSRDEAPRASSSGLEVSCSHNSNAQRSRGSSPSKGVWHSTSSQLRSQQRLGKLAAHLRYVVLGRWYVTLDT